MPASGSGWQSVRGVDQRGTGLRRRGGGFVPARERICAMRGNSISPLGERTHSHSRRVTVMPSPVYFSFHLLCRAHHEGPSWPKSNITQSWKHTQRDNISRVSNAFSIWSPKLNMKKIIHHPAFLNFIRETWLGKFYKL